MSVVDLINGDHLIYVSFTRGFTSILIAGQRYKKGSTPTSFIVNKEVAPGSLSFADIAINSNGIVMIKYPENNLNVAQSTKIFINTLDGSIPSSNINWNKEIVATTSNLPLTFEIPSQKDRGIVLFQD